MAYSSEQIEELKRYCLKLSSFSEAGTILFYMEKLRLPSGCTPDICDALLCPTTRRGYPSILYFSSQIQSAYTRNWNVLNERIGEKNWFAFSWRVDSPSSTLQQLLIAHLNGFAKVK
jgi:hypothetical protein